ncbi:MAG: DUF523 domain-containing protein [Planctomycetes bacterium]|nr:DUF523 domain-containing protein [Planctomycetota bacterium]
MQQARHDRSPGRTPEQWAALVTELRDLFWIAPAQRPRVAVSSCLLGEAVRWDGGHKRNDVLIAELASWAELVATCPEVGMGMSVPRPPLIVRASGGNLALVEREGATASGRDWTAALDVFARDRLRAIAPLDGFVWKSRSPSCGAAGVTVHEVANGATRAVATGAGIFVCRARVAFRGVAEIEESGFARESTAAAFRIAAEWSLAWRSAAGSARSIGGVARVHRKLRDWWIAVATPLARRLDRVAGESRGVKPSGAGAWAAAYEQVARGGLRALVGVAARSRGGSSSVSRETRHRVAVRIVHRLAARHCTKRGLRSTSLIR